MVKHSLSTLEYVLIGQEEIGKDVYRTLILGGHTLRVGLWSSVRPSSQHGTRQMFSPLGQLCGVVTTSSL